MNQAKVSIYNYQNNKSWTKHSNTNIPDDERPSEIDDNIYKNKWGSKVLKKSIWSWARHSNKT